ncbi:MAG TPA: hypothetical protein VFF06_00305, partial [Polyangia bacterium]|nr:hypothetical protein [Polyangia bacterium]
TSETIFDLENLVELGHRFGAGAVKTQALVPHKELNLGRLRLKTLDDVAMDRGRACIERAQRMAESYGMEFRHLNAEDPFNEPDPEWNDIQTVDDAPGAAAENGGAASHPFRQCLEPWKELWINVGDGLNTCERRRFDVPEGADVIPLRELWESPGLERVRHSLLKGPLDPICGGCILRKASDTPPDPAAWALGRIRTELEYVRSELRGTKGDLTKTRAQLEQTEQATQKDVGDVQSQIEQVRSELERAREEAEHAKRDLERTRADAEEAKRRLERAREHLAARVWRWSAPARRLLRRYLED